MEGWELEFVYVARSLTDECVSDVLFFQVDGLALFFFSRGHVKKY